MLGPKQDMALIKVLVPNTSSTFVCSIRSAEKNAAVALERLSLTSVIRQKEIIDEVTLQYF